MPVEVLPEALRMRVSELIALRTGLHFPPQRQADLLRALTETARALGQPDAQRCAEWLLSSPLTPEQLDTLASHLTVGETYFFRDEKIFEALEEHVLPELIAKRRRSGDLRLRMWSAACSSGEEAYSLAILLQGVLADWQDWNISILGTDLNKRSLEKAVAGEYGEWSFRECSGQFRDAYFTRTAQGRFEVTARVRSLVKFAHLNLAQQAFPSAATDTNAMDLIFCRNVLMYFAPEAARKVTASLRDALLPGGWLIVSPSECSQTLFQGFGPVNFPGAILYCKHAGGVGPANHKPAFSYTDVDSLRADSMLTAGATMLPTEPAADAAGSVEAPRAVPEPDNVSASQTIAGPLATAESLYAQGRYNEAADVLLTLFAAEDGAESVQPEHRSRALALRARSLANQGRLTEAVDWCTRWIEAEKLDPIAHYVQALVLQALGRRDHARRALQRAIYLQPDGPLFHFALGNLEPGDGVNRHFQTALRVLSRMPPDAEVLESDGLTAGQLMQIILALSNEGTEGEVKSERARR